MLLAEDLLLLLYDDETGKPVTGSTETDYALAGAVLLELVMAGRVDVTEKGRLVVRDAAPTGDPVLDDRLAILARKEGAKPAKVIGKLAKNLRRVLLDRLAGKGILQAEQGKVLGLFPVTRWPAQDARHDFEPHTALDAVLCTGTEPDQRTAALIALLHAVGAVPKVVTGSVDRKALKRRAKQIAESAWAADAVRRAVQAVQAATAAAIVAASSAATSSS